MSDMRFCLLLIVFSSGCLLGEDVASVIKQMAAAAPSDFALLRGTRQLEESWESKLSIPGAQSCVIVRIDPHRISDGCIMFTGESTEAAAALQKADELKRITLQTFPDWSPSKNNSDTVFALEGPGGISVSVVWTIGKAVAVIYNVVHQERQLANGKYPKRVAVRPSGVAAREDSSPLPQANDQAASLPNRATTQPDAKPRELPIHENGGAGLRARTRMSVRLLEDMSSDAAAAGKLAQAELIQPVVGMNMQVLMPVGTQVYVRAYPMQVSNFSPHSVPFQLAIDHVTFRGRAIQIPKSPVYRQAVAARTRNSVSGRSAKSQRPDSSFSLFRKNSMVVFIVSESVSFSE